MWWATFNYGRRGAPIIAMSSIDIALWDIIGKATGKPVWKLLGGHRDRVAAYGSGINTNFTLSELVEQNNGFVNDGFKAVKMKIGRRGSAEIVERVKAVRTAIGSEIALMVDANNGWSIQTAIKMAKKLERFDIFWIEEPIIADDVEGYAKLCATTDIPIATGESHYTKHDFKLLIERKGVDIVQADATKMGGVTEWMKVAAIAEAWGLPMAPHAYPQIHTSLVAAVPNGLIVEFINGFIAGKPYQLLPWLNPTIPKNGYVEPLENPGLGLEIDEEAVMQYRSDNVDPGTFSTNRGKNWPPFL
jgi:L-alanine-DL-glutamate epimerase-like enolase superfamily enzyme